MTILSVRSWVLILFLAAVGAGAAPVAPVADTNAPPVLPSVFRFPIIQEVSNRLMAEGELRLTRGEPGPAEELFQKVVALAPFAPAGLYDLACAQARLGKTDDAFTTLTLAIARGYNDARHMQDDDDLKSLRADRRFRTAVEQAKRSNPPELKRTIQAQLVRDGVAEIGETNVLWNARDAVLLAFFRFDSTNAAPTEIVRGHGEVGDLLRQWFKDGTAAGHVGDLYDNRDAGHSTLNCEPFPQLTRTKYSPDAVANQIHYGLQTTLFFNTVVLGNSSTAQVGTPYWRSQTRMAYVNPRLASVLANEYFGNHIYVYPEHRDHKPGHNGEGGYGDVFPANTPYLITSQGSSGSDQPFLDAIAVTLAAFRPEVKKLLVTYGALMPTLQMIFRTCNKQVTKPADYLTGLAHPSVFEGGDVDAVKMVRMAHDIRSNNVPPLVALRVVEEDAPLVGRDYFDIGPREKLFDTPAAIARVWRSTQGRRRMVVSAEGSQDLNHRPLTWHWVVLRGDADAIKITRLNKDGSVVELQVPWPARRTVRPGLALESNRIDIACFVHNDAYYSAPGFITFFGLDNEARQYDAAGHIQSITYTGADDKGNYVDPLLDLPKSWRDEYHYDTKGRITGWTRFVGDAHEDFTAAGELVVRRDTNGRPTQTRKVKYVAKQRAPEQPPVLIQEPGEIVLHH